MAAFTEPPPPPPGIENPVVNCSAPTDNFLGNAQALFNMGDWISRGLCVRHGLAAWGDVPTYECYARLENILENNLNAVRAAEYAGAAGVLALLPTIGALLGTPTNEIWRLLTMIPFGGFIAMACSFGGAILPVKIKDYESDFMKKNIKNKLRGRQNSSTLELPSILADDDQENIKARADILMAKVQERLQKRQRRPVPKMYILVGITGMSLLLAASQAAMIIVELGAVLPWWCDSKWWVHLWYCMVLVSSAVDNWVQLPFVQQWKICLSDVPYDLNVDGGDIITESAMSGKNHEVESVTINIKQLKTLKRGTLDLITRFQKGAEPRNVLFVLVSVAEKPEHNWKKTFIRSFSKITSIAVYVVGTASFASAQLLSISMATFVLTCVLGAGVFGRAITSWIVAGIETSDPMMHFVATREEEAHFVLTRLFTIGVVDPSDPKTRQVQVELDGQVFLDCRRVAARTWWLPLLMGVLASPVDLGKVARRRRGDNGRYEIQEDLEASNDHNTDGTSRMVKPALYPRSTFASGSTSINGGSMSRHSTNNGGFEMVSTNSTS